MDVVEVVEGGTSWILTLMNVDNNSVQSDDKYVDNNNEIDNHFSDNSCLFQSNSELQTTVKQGRTEEQRFADSDNETDSDSEPPAANFVETVSSVVSEEHKLTECTLDESSINKFDANQAAIAKQIIKDHELRSQLNEIELEHEDDWCGLRWKRPMSPCLSSPVTQEYTKQEIYLELDKNLATYG